VSAAAFQRAWEYSRDNQEALARLSAGGVWRVYEAPPTPLLERPEEPDEMIQVRVIQLRCQRLGNVDPIWVIQARYEDGPGDWAEVTTGKMVW
jgi:hypothetical protein